MLIHRYVHGLPSRHVLGTTMISSFLLYSGNTSDESFPCAIPNAKKLLVEAVSTIHIDAGYDPCIRERTENSVCNICQIRRTSLRLRFAGIGDLRPTRAYVHLQLGEQEYCHVEGVK